MTIDFLTKKIKKEKWRKRGKWLTPVFVYEIIEKGEASSSQKRIKHPFQRSMGVWLDSGEYFDLQREWDDVYKLILRKYKENSKYLSEYGNSCLAAGEEVILFSKKIRKADYSKISNVNLAKKYSEFAQKCMGFMPYMFTMHLVDKLLTFEFEKYLKIFAKDKKLNKDDYFKYQNALAYPERKIFALEERTDFLKILIKNNGANLSSPQVLNAVKKHAEKYGWMNMVNWEGFPFDEKYFFQKYKNTLKTDFQKEYKSLIKENNRIKKFQIKALKEAQGYKKLTELSKSIQMFGFLRSFRVDVLSISLFSAWPLIREIAARLRLNPMDVREFTSEEINRALAGEIGILNILNKRKKGISGIIYEDELFLLDKDEIKQIKEYLLEADDTKDEIKEVVGNIAYPGKSKGVCKVVHSLGEMDKIRKGDILVISMTDPNYLPAMEKAAAFVTDFGGILCHAAIVSREMKKPCIIGTKIATQVLKDGDLVEVDAEKGIVRILEKAKK
jgi:phosphohistidine swiveling domain-containing protein